jgi:hypothetical protein
MFTTDPIYRKPLVPRITIKSLDGATTYYTYDPWTDIGTTTKAVSCSVNLSQNHQGIFTVVIEDETNAISSNVNLGARLIIECGKQSSQMTRLISGLVRQKGYSRGADRKRLLTLSGSSTAIRLNEKILYYVNEAAKLAQDNITIDINDVTRKADLLLQNGLAALTTEGVINAGGVVTSSDVENFIASLAIEYGEAQDLCNTLEEQTNGEIFVDVNDLVQFRHQFQPATAGRGFTIKNKNATNDDANDTMYLRGKSWDYTESCLKSDGYSNRIYGILPAEQVPSTREEMGYLSAGFNATVGATNQEVAQKFRPTHSHFLPGDIMVVAGQATVTASLSPWAMRFRICSDSGGIPQNVGGIVANIDMQGINFEGPVKTTADQNTFVVASDQLFFNSANAQIDGFYLDTTKDYWLILSNDNITGSSSANYWGARTAAGGTTMLTAGPFSTNSAGGSGWTSVANVLMIFALPRVRSEAFECADSKAVIWLGAGLTTGGNLIESMLPNIPSTIKTRNAMYRYLANQIYYMARPRINWNMATVTAPNVPVLPGDPIMISDSVMGFSTAGQQVMMTTCGDMTYSWQIGDYQAPTILSIQPICNPTFYK